MQSFSKVLHVACVIYCSTYIKVHELVHMHVYRVVACFNALHLVRCSGWTPLHSAATEGHLAIVSLLISAGGCIFPFIQRFHQSPPQNAICTPLREEDYPIALWRYIVRESMVLDAQRLGILTGQYIGALRLYLVLSLFRKAVQTITKAALKRGYGTQEQKQQGGKFLQVWTPPSPSNLNLRR